MLKKHKVHGVKARTTVADAARQTLAVRLAEFDSRAGALDAPDDAEALHELRIAAKRLRYTIELFQDVLPATSADLLSELKQLQDDLGFLHDRDVLIARLQDDQRQAAAREVTVLTGLATAPAPRAERLAAIAARLQGDESPAKQALGQYGLLADALDERRARLTALRDRWQALNTAGFLRRLHALTEAGVDQQ